MRIKLISIFLIMLLYGCNSSILDDPSTTIKYSVAQRSHVKLTVENSYNTLISTLVDREQNAGVYQVTFDVSNLAEGLYFYIIEAKGIENNYYYKSTKKLLLVK